MANDDESEGQQAAPYPAVMPLPERHRFPPLATNEHGKEAGSNRKLLTAADILGPPDEAMTASADAKAAAAEISAVLPKSYLRDFNVSKSILSEGISCRLGELAQSEMTLAKRLRESSDFSAHLAKQLDPLKHQIVPPSVIDIMGRGAYQPDLQMPVSLEVPRNPVYDTNEKLKTLVDQMGALHILTEATAKVHSQQSAMVSELVAATVASARALEESAKDAKNNKKITFLSLIIAIIVALPQLFGNNGLWPFQPTWDKVQTEIEAIVYDVFN